MGHHPWPLNADPEEMKNVPAAALTRYVAAIMEGGGSACWRSADHRAPARRFESRRPRFARRAARRQVPRMGRATAWLRPNTPPTVVFDSDAIAIVDGNRGFGQVIGEFATRLGIAKAAKTGIAMIGLRNCGHLGRLGDWADMAAEAGQVSLHFLNTSGAQRVAPFGGSDRRLSTNPHGRRRAARRRRSGDPRHHDVDGRRRQADGRAEQGRASAARVDRRQATAGPRPIRRISTMAARCSPSARTRARACRSSPICSPAR